MSDFAQGCAWALLSCTVWPSKSEAMGTPTSPGRAMAAPAKARAARAARTGSFMGLVS